MPFKITDFGTNRKPIITYLLFCTVCKLWLIIGQIFVSDRRSLRFNVLAGVIPCEYRHKWYIVKTRFFGLHFNRWMYRCIFNHFYVIGPKTSEFGEITQTTRPLRRSRSFTVTDFGANRKPICDFLLVINGITFLLSCAVSKLWASNGRIFSIDRGVPHFNAPTGGDSLRISG